MIWWTYVNSNTPAAFKSLTKRFQIVTKERYVLMKVAVSQGLIFYFDSGKIV